MVQDILSEAKAGMAKAIEAFKHEMTTVRTGRANSALLDTIRVEYYGSMVPVNQVANITVPEARLVVLTPFDKTVIPALEKAVQASSLGLNPSNDGNVVRLPIPQLTEERRKELVKVVHHMAEECKVSIRNHRRDANDMLKEGQKEGEIPEDESKKAHDQVQKITDENIVAIDELLKTKDEEIMEV